MKKVLILLAVLMVFSCSQNKASKKAKPQGKKQYSYGVDCALTTIEGDPKKYKLKGLIMDLKKNCPITAPSILTIQRKYAEMKVGDTNDGINLTLDIGENGDTAAYYLRIYKESRVVASHKSTVNL